MSFCKVLHLFADRVLFAAVSKLSEALRQLQLLSPVNSLRASKFYAFPSVGTMCSSRAYLFGTRSSRMTLPCLSTVQWSFEAYAPWNSSGATLSLLNINWDGGDQLVRHNIRYCVVFIFGHRARELCCNGHRLDSVHWRAESGPGSRHSYNVFASFACRSAMC
jgi:hypothetical protein